MCAQVNAVVTVHPGEMSIKENGAASQRPLSPKISDLALCCFLCGSSHPSLQQTQSSVATWKWLPTVWIVHGWTGTLSFPQEKWESNGEKKWFSVPCATYDIYQPLGALLTEHKHPKDPTMYCFTALQLLFPRKALWWSWWSIRVNVKLQ